MAAGAFGIGLNEVQVGLFPGLRIFRVYARLIGEARAVAQGSAPGAPSAWPSSASSWP